MDAIRCAGLSKNYRDVQALKPLDLTVEAGSIFGFLGRNGAGKTTTMRLLAGLARPTSGSAWIMDIEATQADSTARQQFGYLPQDPTFYNWMTPREYLHYVAALFQMDAAERQQRVDEMLELAGLKDAAKRHIGGFSGGMHQRLGIAQAFIHRPPVLLLDEPTSSLDPAGRYEVLEMIAGLRGQVTVFLSSHILSDIERVCDTVGIIHQGQLLLVAKRDELLARYATNVIALQVERESLPALDGFVAQVQAQPWVVGTTINEDELRISVSDPATSKQALWPLVAEHGLALSRYEWIHPSLEEIFLALSQS
ncbi:MAG: ABC transporter ATP-binding protein [Anaerolineae bacterium]|nr:ABC transporter ATP-binding protein [Anaerolineae bacterium]